MFRLIIVLVGLFIGFRLLLHFLVKLVDYINNYQNFSNHPNNYNNHPKNKGKNMIQDLAKCDYCGLYIIKEEAVSYHGRVFCCKEHAQSI